MFKIYHKRKRNENPMKILNIIKYFILISALIFIFINYKISAGLFVLSSILHVVPFGPYHLLKVIIGYLLIGALICFFINWKIAILLIICASVIAKFTLWSKKVNDEYYNQEDKTRAN